MPKCWRFSLHIMRLNTDWRSPISAFEVQVFAFDTKSLALISHVRATWFEVIAAQIVSLDTPQ